MITAGEKLQTALTDEREEKRFFHDMSNQINTEQCFLRQSIIGKINTITVLVYNFMNVF